MKTNHLSDMVYERLQTYIAALQLIFTQIYYSLYTMARNTLPKLVYKNP